MIEHWPTGGMTVKFWISYRPAVTPRLDEGRDTLVFPHGGGADTLVLEQ
jgi:hypothetical protein